MSERQSIKTYLREFETELHPNESQPAAYVLKGSDRKWANVIRADGGLNDLDNLLTELSLASHPSEPAPLPEYDNVESLMAELKVGRVETNQPHIHVPRTYPELALLSFPPEKEKTSAPAKVQAVATTGGGANARTNANDDLDAIIGNMNFDEDADVSVAFCQQCRGAIGAKERQLTAFGRKYHPNHFYCNGCKAQMGFGAFYEKDGCAYCDKCFGTILTVKCSACLSREYLRVGENRYHPHCFKCVACRREIDHYYLVGNQYYCDKDYILKCAPRCDDCHNPIPGKNISAMGRTLHPNCFICQQCSRPIHDRFFNVGGRPMCSSCDPRKLVVSHPQHERPRLQAATVVISHTTAIDSAPPASTYAQKLAPAAEPLSPRENEFAARRVHLAAGGSNRRTPVDAESMRTARKARTPEMRKRATEVATERQAAWKSMQPKPWKDSPSRPDDMLATLAGYHLENGADGPAMGEVNLRVERDTSLYKETMMDVDHDNFVAVNDPDENPIIVSVDDDAVKEDGKKHYRAIVRTCKADTRVLVGCEKKKDRLKALRELMEEQRLATSEAKFKQVKKAEICTDLAEFDTKNFKNRFKFGMLYAQPEQTDEKAMFNNQEGSPAFYAFLDIIAKRHHVEDWKEEWSNYNGGLNNQTGKDFYYTTFQEAEIILHVSTLLPYIAADPQKLERKRHLGNDVLMVVFRDGPGVQLSPDMFNSHFNHVFMVVEPSGANSYRVNVSSKTGVKTHNPPLPRDGVIPTSALRDWFLCKAINAESKAMQSPDFSHALLRTRKQMLGDIIKKYS